MLKNGLLKNTTIYALGDIIPKVLSFIIFPILTKYLSPADYGIVNYVMTLNFLLMTAGFLCLNTYYLVFYYRMDNLFEQQKLLGNLTLFIFGLNFFFTLLLLLLGNYFSFFFGDKIAFFPYIAIGIVTNFFSMLTVLPSALYRLEERPLPLTVLNVLKSVLTMGLTILLVVYYKFTALGVLYSTLIVSVIFGVLFLWITLKNMIWNFDWTQIRRALYFSLPLLPGSLAYYFLSMADRLFIERYLDLTQLGIYSTASTIAMILNIVSYGAYKAFEPYFFKTYGTNTFNMQFVKVQKVFFLVILFGAMCLSMFAQEFFFFFASESYQSVYYYVPMLEIGVVFSALTMLYGTILTAQGKTKTNSIITIIGGIVSVILNVLLLPILGITAACLASGLAFGIMLGLSVYFSRLKISFIHLIISFLVAVVGVCLVVYAFHLPNIGLRILEKAVVLCLCTLIIIRFLGLNLRNILTSFQNK